MRIIGLDLGSKTLGIAISDGLGMIAQPLVTIHFTEDDYDDAIEQLLSLLEKQQVCEVVLGLPKHMNGDIGIRGEISISFKEKLEENKIEVTLWDERLTTRVANQTLLAANMSREKRKKVVDQLAAAVILQSYLDSRQ